MLKIKDNVDLKELEKFGYKLGQNTICVPYGSYGKIYKEKLDKILTMGNGVNNLKDILFIPTINTKNKEIILGVTARYGVRTFEYRYDDAILPYIQDLIESGLVEKVSDE